MYINLLKMIALKEEQKIKRDLKEENQKENHKNKKKVREETEINTNKNLKEIKGNTKEENQGETHKKKKKGGKRNQRTKDSKEPEKLKNINTKNPIKRIECIKFYVSAGISKKVVNVCVNPLTYEHNQSNYLKPLCGKTLFFFHVELSPSKEFIRVHYMNACTKYKFRVSYWVPISEDFEYKMIRISRNQDWAYGETPGKKVVRAQNSCKNIYFSSKDYPTIKKLRVCLKGYAIFEGEFQVNVCGSKEFHYRLELSPNAQYYLAWTNNGCTSLKWKPSPWYRVGDHLRIGGFKASSDRRWVEKRFN